MPNKISKNVKAMGIVSFFNDMSTDMVYPLIPIFLTKVLGATMPVVGLIEGIAETTASLMKVFSGWLSDKLKKRKPLTVIGYSLSMITKPLLAFAGAPWHVLVVRFGDRFGKGLRQAPRDALIAESTDSKYLGYAYGFHKAMDTFGATAGPLLAVVLLPLLNENLRSLFLLSFAASFFAVITLVIFVKEKPDNIPSHRTLPKLSLKNIPFSYKLFLLSIAVFALGNSSDAFLFLRAQNLGVSIALVPVLYAISNVVSASLSSALGRLADKIGAHRIMIGGYAVFALCYAGFAAANSSYLMWILFPMYGVFSAMTESMQKTITVKISDPQLKGTMLGLTHTTVGLLQLPASVLAGFLWQKIGAPTPFLFGSFAAIIAAAILTFSAFASYKNQKATLQETR